MNAGNSPVPVRSSRFLWNYRTDGTPAARLERVLAIGRAFLTVSGLVAIYIDPTEPARLAELTYAVLFGYALYSVIVLTFVHRATRLGSRDGQILHGIDILWTAGLTFISSGPGSPFFLFFLFVQLAAAYRWGFRETLLTTTMTVGIFLVETAIAGAWNPALFPWRDLETNRTILRVVYFVLTGCLIGYLAEEEKDLRAEISAVADAGRQPRVELGLGGSVTAVSLELLRIFDAAAVDVVIQDFETRRTMLWRVEGRATQDNARRTLHLELDPSQQAAWLFDDPGRAWHARKAPGASTLPARVVEPGVWPLQRTTVTFPSALTEAREFTTVTAGNMGLGDEWRGRVYLFDAANAENLERSLHFLEALTEHITPALTNVFLLRRLRSRAGAMERARVARELHDGAIQALFGIEMRIDALRRRAAVNPQDVEPELAEVQELLRSEVLELRELMQALRPIELETSDQLPDVLASLVERFRRDTGVSARFVFDGSPVTLPASAALELARIVQEALVNVRKHSRARNVLVRLTNSDQKYTLVVEDDGQGFEFEGRLSHRELEKRRVGPAIIKERARIAGAQLAVDSAPGIGARLELTLEAGVHA